MPSPYYTEEESPYYDDIADRKSDEKNENETRPNQTS